MNIFEMKRMSKNSNEFALATSMGVHFITISKDFQFKQNLSEVYLKHEMAEDIFELGKGQIAALVRVN
jgi:hypothetical protein